MPFPDQPARPGMPSLDQPPPTPAFEDASRALSPDGQASPMARLAGSFGPGIDPVNSAPQIQRALLRRGREFDQYLDTLAEVMPQLTPDFNRLQAALRAVLGKMLSEGAVISTEPDDPGPGFPGGGFASAGRATGS